MLEEFDMSIEGMSINAETRRRAVELRRSPEAPWTDCPPFAMSAFLRGKPYTLTGASSNTVAWHRARRTGIGASEIAMVLGVSKWGDAGTVYAAKVSPEEQRTEEWLEWGHRLEAPIAEAFTSSRYAGASAVEERSHVIQGDLARSVEYPWALATLDATVFDLELRTSVPLEIKTARDSDDWTDGVPEYYAAQAHQQMLVTGAQRVYVACLVAGSRLVWDRVDRDESWQRRIVKAGSELWQRIIDRDPPPSSDHGALSRMYAFEKGSQIELGEPELLLSFERDELTADIKRKKAKLDAIDAKLKQAIGSHHTGLLPDGSRFSWAPRRDGVRVLRRVVAK